MLSQLEVLRGATKKNKRIGRGPGSGHGKTATRGHKGKKARSHGVVQRGFEGGQMPLHRRLPKFGFTNIFRTEYSTVNLDQLARFDGTVTPEILVKAGIAKTGLPIKVLGRGQLTKKLIVKAHKFSDRAGQGIKSAGGTIEEIK
ncbi:MAG: 50S ribosomal protein L15 [Oligoflexia bacterium]|nr:50S ribosomal protein L15 [Oligoflexia bacterium]